ncbi:MAG: outer membrane protein TolC [Planctomycetota bacterium]
MLGLLLSASVACAAASRPRPIDKDLDLAVETVLARARGLELDGRENRVALPRNIEVTEPSASSLSPGADTSAATDPGPQSNLEGTAARDSSDALPVEPQIYDLERTLEAAFHTNREMISRRESLYLDVLSLMGSRHSYNPQISAMLSTTFSDSEEGLASYGATFSPSISQRLTHGGNLSLSGRTSWNARDGFFLEEVGEGVDARFEAVDSPDEYDLSASFSYSQPLLRGFGYDVSHESLIQAERNLIYAVRDFELFREDFSINAAQQFYSLVEQKQSVANQHENIDISDFQLRKAQAMYDIGRGTQIDLFRAERTELQDRNSLIQAEQDFDLALDRFKIFLGIDIDTPIEIVDAQPPEILINYDTDSAVDIARKNRLDYLTRKQRLEDSERSLRLSRDGLRSDLNLNAGYSLSGDPDTSLSGASADDEAWSVGLNWDMPLDRVSERHSHRSAQIGHARAIRDFETFDETLEIEIKSSFRGLARILESIRIQETLIISQEKNLKKAQIDYEQGGDNREVSDAQRALTSAKNGKIREQVNYEIARLRLLQDLGILFVDSQGMWKEAK